MILAVKYYFVLNFIFLLIQILLSNIIRILILRICFLIRNSMNGHVFVTPEKCVDNAAQVPYLRYPLPPAAPGSRPSNHGQLSFWRTSSSSCLVLDGFGAGWSERWSQA